MSGQHRVNFLQFAAGRQFAIFVVEHANPHSQKIRQRLLPPKRGINRQVVAFAQLRRQRLDQGFAAAQEPVALRQPHRDLAGSGGQRHKGPPQLLGQRSQIMLHFRFQVARHRPVERRGRQRLGLTHAHVERHPVLGSTGFVGVVERQSAVVER